LGCVTLGLAPSAHASERSPGAFCPAQPERHVGR
jgi:hypothetical protein